MSEKNAVGGTSPPAADPPGPSVPAHQPEDAHPAASAHQPEGARPPGPSRLAAWLAVAAITGSVVVMIGISAAGPNVSVPSLPRASGWPWSHDLHLTATFVTMSLWFALVLGGAGVIGGLVAVARGARLPVRPLIALACLAIAILTVLPAAGSTDAISYAANGRMAATGHSPYVMTPVQLKQAGDPVGRQIPFAEIPPTWTNTVSVYGPVATGAEWIAAEFGGTSLARVTFWLKLEEAIAFGAVILILDRMLRKEPEMRLRAHLLWSLNPLLLWQIVASGHVDGLAAAFGLLGVLALATRRPQAGPRQHSGQQPPSREQGGPRQQIGLGGAAAAGLLIGVATGVKVEYALFGLAVAWACRSSLRALAAATAGFAVVVGPAFVAAGTPAIKVLFTRSGGVTWDTMYQLVWRPVFGYTQFSVSSFPPHLEQIAYLLFAVVAVVGVLRFPDRVPGRPAVTPALALSLAWLFVTAFQRPWYDVMAVSLLALYSASWLDWVVLIRLLAGATIYVQAVQSPAEPHWLYDLGQFNGTWFTPAVRLLAAVALVWLGLAGRRAWRARTFSSSERLPELLSQV